LEERGGDAIVVRDYIHLEVRGGDWLEIRCVRKKREKNPTSTKHRSKAELIIKGGKALYELNGKEPCGKGGKSMPRRRVIPQWKL